ncbi:cob(I)alamin adenosyltransferase [Actinopolymorpha cephalotaxi]|uniref:Corrinoid adenosyltransferase n=1 Tax=Actinopolymorpha cephalotaxi TaxID=504797 RepID=A0A1I2ZET8_9ACTN|nr:cob(I)yrinic acid a,c-diamide adenosyltransferase [Actinopolymorpha cephalotaxi]NYH81937.1 cob(I)alamin adenosyltransferase [Actinopolymorpha cephalotaxi]SFH36125.1 cob(I)alamin adenosyltransferase [Actinopolymorpha cephalotaxi]
MVNLTRIYTRAGDGGRTRLVDNSLVTKTDRRLAAYADVDEANASIGAALALGDLAGDVAAVLVEVQNDLFDLGADLGNPVDPGAAPGAALRITPEYVERLEAHCDAFNERVEPLRSFVLPGGTPGAALLHTARTVTRRAERTAWAAWEEHADTMNADTIKYLNRLSDLLFILARVANADRGDVLWQPGGGRADQAERS